MRRGVASRRLVELIDFGLRLRPLRSTALAVSRPVCLARRMTFHTLQRAAVYRVPPMPNTCIDRRANPAQDAGLCPKTV